MNILVCMYVGYVCMYVRMLDGGGASGVSTPVPVTTDLSPFLSVTGLGAPLSSSLLKRRCISLQNE